MDYICTKCGRRHADEFCSDYFTSATRNPSESVSLEDNRRGWRGGDYQNRRKLGTTRGGRLHKRKPRLAQIDWLIKSRGME